MEIFDCAIKMEQEAQRAYQRLVDVATVPELKNLYSLLAAAEQEHYEALLKLKQSVDLQQTEFSSLDDAVCVFKLLLGKRDLMEELMDDADAFKHVVREEEESVRLYEELAAQAQNEETKRVLLLIAAEEQKHLNIVENIYAFVEAPRTFLEWREFSNLKPL